MGNAWKEKNNLIKARSIYLEAETIQPDHLEIKKRLAGLYFDEGNLDEAGHRYNHLIELDKDVSVYMTRLNQIEKREQSAQLCMKELWYAGQAIFSWVQLEYRRQ